MKDKQKVYIKGNIERGDEVIKYLEDLGGRNSHSINGKNVNAYYFINPRGVITNCPPDDNGGIFSYIKEFYKKIELPKWKPEYRDYYYYFTSNGCIQQDIWDNTAINDLYYEFGNCFKTFEEAELARDNIKEILNK